MSDLTLYDLGPSPNNIKVRLALGYKALPYEKVPVNPEDRSRLVEISGQPLTPVLVHGDRVLFDSSAILRYLDANFRETPRLFSSDYDRIKEIEGWELWHRTELTKPIGIVFEQYFAQGTDPAAIEQAGALLATCAGQLAEALAATGYLVGDGVTAADLICAPFALYGMVDERMAGASPIAAHFRAHLRMPEEHAAVRDWVGRIMAYDS